MPRKKKEQPVSPPTSGTHIENCTFTANPTVNFDKASMEIVKVVAMSLYNLTELFKKQGLVIESLLKVEGK